MHFPQNTLKYSWQNRPRKFHWKITWTRNELCEDTTCFPLGCLHLVGQVPFGSSLNPIIKQANLRILHSWILQGLIDIGWPCFWADVFLRIGMAFITIFRSPFGRLFLELVPISFQASNNQIQVVKCEVFWKVTSSTTRCRFETDLSLSQKKVGEMIIWNSHQK